MKLIFPPDAATAAERLRHCLRLRERLRRRNNWYVARADAAEARRFHREWFLPRNRAITAAALRLRKRVFGNWRPAGQDDAEPPWIPDRRRIRRLRDDDNELEGIKLAEAFEGAAAAADPPDPTEDYTTYTTAGAEIGKLTVTANNIAFDTLWRKDQAMVYFDKGASHFGAAFEHNVDFRISAVVAAGYVHPWTVTNTIDYAYRLWADQRDAVMVRVSGDRVYMFACNGQDIDYSTTAYTLNVWKYLTVERTSETALECRLYDDSDRTSLDDTIFVSVTSGERYRYIMGCNSYDSSTNASITGEVANLDLQEAAATGLPIPVAMHHYTQLRGDA